MSFEIVKAEQLPLLPENWDYGISVASLKPKIDSWKRLTTEIATELFIAREKLSQSGLRTDLGTIVPRLPTWAEYCESIGIEKRTANRWIASVFGPARLPSPPLPKLESQVLYADPPWSYHNEGFEESATNFYPTLSLKEICDFTDKDGKKVTQLTTDKAVLFLWVTYPLADEGFEVIKAWGFEYKAQMVWIKNKTLPIGWWVKPRHELLYIAAKGEAAFPAVKFDSIFEYEATEHSKKPAIVYEWIEQMYTGPYIELFARNTRPGWESWGNQVGELDEQ